MSSLMPDEDVPIYGALEPHLLLQYAVLNESNIMITGLPGAGKTTLIKTALRNLPKGYAAIIFDTAYDYGEDVCHEYGVFSVDVRGIDPGLVNDIIEEALETVYGSYTYRWTPAMAMLVIRALEAGVGLNELSDRVLTFAGPQEQSTAISVARRARYFKRPHFGSAPPLVPKPGQVTCVDLNELDSIARNAYVLFALHTLKHKKNIIFVIDEAHRFMYTSRKLITDYMRIGRHNAHLFVLITHGILDVKERPVYVKIFVHFLSLGMRVNDPRWETPSYKALMTIYITNPRVMTGVGDIKPLPGQGRVRRYFITVEPLKSPSDFSDVEEYLEAAPG